MNTLDKIVARKHEEVAHNLTAHPISELEHSSFFNRTPLSLREFLLRKDKSGIITEFKRRSPSRGDINVLANVVEVTKGYAAAGASGLSILTDEHFFGGKNADLTAARMENDIPILRKDFIIHDYQVLEAKSIGADVILLIAECLEKNEVKHLAKMAKSLGLEVLLEVHSADQLEKLNEYVDILGINNRNLKDFTVSIQTSLDLFPLIPNEFLKISESGINDPQVVVQLKEAGFQGFLMGEHFMNTASPHLAVEAFIQKIEQLEDYFKNAIA
jgi:indole-3-glycerol phosphate synthase